MDDAHPFGLAGAASSSTRQKEKCAVRRVGRTLHGPTSTKIVAGDVHCACSGTVRIRAIVYVWLD